MAPCETPLDDGGWNGRTLARVGPGIAPREGVARRGLRWGPSADFDRGASRSATNIYTRRFKKVIALAPCSGATTPLRRNPERGDWHLCLLSGTASALRANYSEVSVRKFRDTAFQRAQPIIKPKVHARNRAAIKATQVFGFANSASPITFVSVAAAMEKAIARYRWRGRRFSATREGGSASKLRNSGPSRNVSAISRRNPASRDRRAHARPC